MSACECALILLFVAPLSPDFSLACCRVVLSGSLASRGLCSVRRHLGSTMVSYSPSTQGFLEAWSLQAVTLFFLREHEVELMEKERPGAMLAWREIVSRECPSAPAAPFFFKPENYRKESVRPPQEECASAVQARPGPLVPRAWKGLPASAHARPDQARSDAAKRAAAAQRALELVRKWPQGDHAKAREELAAGDLASWERRFVDTFAAGGGTPTAWTSGS